MGMKWISHRIHTDPSVYENSIWIIRKTNFEKFQEDSNPSLVRYHLLSNSVGKY